MPTCAVFVLFFYAVAHDKIICVAQDYMAQTSR